MPISQEEFANEKKRLQQVLNIIRTKISSLGQELYDDEEKVLEFKKFLWDSKAGMDAAEMRTMMSNNDVEISIMMKRGAYLQKLFKVQNKPYFGSIIFKNDIDGEQNIYIGITHVEDNLNYYVHDWRSPICSLFYDYELGNAKYEAPEGIIEGEITRKRQYTIEYGKLQHVFDNEINIDDELLQQVLATESSDKMKNIVNTIQKEQNEVIRNTKDKNMIVQGIAGSGKTSVALHRIAFLLYKLEYLNSNNVLIFSPNQVFSKYISNVLPELGEENTKETSIHSYLLYYLKEFKEIETFSNFIEKHYKKENNIDYKLICYKQSDEIEEDINKYIENLINNTKFIDDIINRDITISKDELNNLLKVKYKHFPLFKRIDVISEKLCDWFYNGKYNKKNTTRKMLLDRLNIKKDYMNIYNNFFKSKYSKINTQDINQIKNKKLISYEDACLYAYMKNMLDGIDYNTDIRQVIIDEAQDYTKMQYKLLFSIFKNANFTILGDINQTINPYYKYESLNILSNYLPNVRYIELLKTYRSSSEIIEYTNKILNLNHVSAIRRENKKEVIERNNITNLKETLIKEINKLKEQYKSVAIITKTLEETEFIYNLIKDSIPITKIDNNSEEYQRDLVILPSYISKGLEFDSVIVYTDPKNKYTKDEKYLFYVACTRCQHQLIVYNQN